MKARSPVFVLLLLLNGCVFVPKNIEYYDKDCQQVRQKYVLTSEQVRLYSDSGGCTNKECLHILAGRVLVTPLSAIISGSIVLVGNAVHWLERTVDCDSRTPQEISISKKQLKNSRVKNSDEAKRLPQY